MDAPFKNKLAKIGTLIQTASQLLQLAQIEYQELTNMIQVEEAKQKAYAQLKQQTKEKTKK